MEFWQVALVSFVVGTLSGVVVSLLTHFWRKRIGWYR